MLDLIESGGLQCVHKTDINMMALVTHPYWSIWKCFTLHMHWLLVFRYAKSHRNLWKEFRNILEFCKMGINYVMNLRPDFMQTNLLLFGCFHKGFTAHLFCKWPLSTLYNRLNASSDFGKHKGMWIKVKCSADLFSYFLRLLSQNRD